MANIESLAGERAISRADAFRRLLSASVDQAYGRAAALLGDRFEAEDAVHDAAERAWRNWARLRHPDRFEAWFGRILVNECRDRLRRRRRIVGIEARAVESNHRMVSSDRAVEIAERDRVRRALARLTPDEQIAVVLRYEGDLTVPAIAELVGAPEGTVKSRLHIALAKLRPALEERGDV